MGQIITDLQDMTHLSWAKARQSSGTAGSFLKSYEETSSGKVYYKLSDYRSDMGVVGHECVNEIVVCRLLEILGVSHLDYRLVHALVRVGGRTVETWLDASSDFKVPGESKIALDAYYDLEREGDESPLDLCVRKGWANRVWEMLVVDYLILNRDRHGANIEVLRNPRARTLRLAPLFDHGLSLVFRCRTSKELESFDVMADLPVQSYLGTPSAWKNLSLIPAGEFPRLGTLCEGDRDAIFDGLEDATSPMWRDVVWSMIWGRWQRLEDLRAS